MPESKSEVLTKINLLLNLDNNYMTLKIKREITEELMMKFSQWKTDTNS